MSSTKHFLKDSFIYTVASWASKVVGFFLIPLYTRIFTPADFGRLELIVTSLLFLSFALELGLKDALARFFNSAESEIEQRAYFSTVFWVKIFTYLPVLLVLILFSGTMSSLLFGNDGQKPLIIWALISVFVSGLWAHLLFLYRLRFKSLMYSLISVLSLTATLLLTVYFIVILQMGIIGIYRAKVLVDSCLVVFLLWDNRAFLKNPDRSKLFPLLHFGLPVMPSEVVYITLEYLDRYFIQIFLGSGTLGIYAIAYKFSTLLTLVTSGFSDAWLPFVYSIYKEENGTATIRTLFKGFALLTTLLAFGIAVFSREILTIFTTPAYIEASKVMYIIVFSLVIYATTKRFCVGIGISKKTHYHLWGGAGAVVANFCLNWILIPRFGIAGAAWATFFSHSLYGGYVMWISQRLYPIDYGLPSFIGMITIFMGCSWYLSTWREISFNILLIKMFIFIIGSIGIPLLVGFIKPVDLVGWYRQLYAIIFATLTREK